MPIRRLSALALVIPFLVGCGGGGSNSVTTPVIPTPIPTALTASAVASNGLTAAISQPTVTVAAGGSVQYTLTLTNTTNQPVTIRTISYAHQAPVLQTGLEVKNPAGNLIFPTNTVGGDGGLPVTSEEVDATLQPGQAMNESIQVSGFKEKGLYTANAGFVVGAGSASGIVAYAGPLTVLAQ